MKSRKKIISGIVITAFIVIGAYAAMAAQQTICPVMGNTLTNKNIYVDYNGKRIYFCCGPCPTRFKQYPEAYLQRLAGIGQEPVPIPK